MSTPLASDEGAAAYCRNCLQRLNSFLDEESKKTAPYSCLLYAASTQIYIIVTKLALSSQESGVISASARFFHILINGEVEGLLDNALFARSLIDLVKRTIGTKIIALSQQDEGDLVELLFGIVTKIRVDPEILPAWFCPAHSQEPTDLAGTKGPNFAGATRRTEFPLFYLLADYVHHDGRTGDFARTGLLYLTDTASKSKELEKWMIESDLATLMASGLGALYSRLSRRLPSITGRERLPAILALSDHSPDSDLTVTSTQSVRHDMDAFLSYLLFWQDTLNHCHSAEVKDTLLDHFQVLFLQQLLYPSLLESSDVAGGSTACVVTYLYQILESLDHADLVRRILDYLLATKDQVMTRTRARKQRMSLSRRKSFDALTALAEARDNPSPDLFSLMDLIIMSLRSKHAQTVAASLKLVSIIQQQHHRYALASLVHTRQEDHRPPLQKLPELNAHLQELMNLAPTISDDGLIDQSYSEILKDVLDSLESHICSPYVSHEEASDQAQVKYRVVIEDDVLLTQMQALLSSFFANDTMTNVALTEAIISMASCRLTSLEGWLLPRSNQIAKSKLFSSLDASVEQVRRWRTQIPEWDSLIALQKSNLNHRDLEDAGVRLPPRRPHSSANSSRPSSLRRSSPQSIEVPDQVRERYAHSVAHPGRLPRTLHSEGFSSINGSVASSPNPPNPLQSRSKVGSPSGERPLAASRTTISRNASDEPDLIRNRSSISPLPPYPADTPKQDHNLVTSGAASPLGTGTPSDQGTGDDPSTAATASLSHILVNAIILQEFILEVAAVVQLRACLWGEVEL